MRLGDYVLCYQTDRREMVGVCELVRFVHTSRGPEKGRNLILRPVEEFQPPVKIHDLKRKKIPALKMVRALQPGVKTLYEVNDQEARILLYACKSGLAISIITAGATKPNGDSKHHGSGFGEAAENRKVEQRSIKDAMKWYKERGWTVVSREKDNIGFDLECSMPGQEIHVEVKGTKGNKDSFPMTEQELHCLKTDPKFVLAVIGNAMSSRPSFKCWKGFDALREFDFRQIVSVSYFANRKH